MDGVEISWHAPKIFWLNSESHQSVYNIIGLYRLISLCSEKTKCVSHVLVSQDCHKKLSHTQQFRDKFILIQFWRTEVYSQGIYKASFSLKVLGENSSLTFPASGGFRHSLASDCITPIPILSSHGLLFFLPVSFCSLCLL